MLDILRYRGFRWMLTGSLFAFLGQWVQQATLGWVVYDITGSGALLGAILAVRAVPMLLFAPFAGVASDRYGRRGLLLSGSIGSGVIAFAFGAALANDWVRTWHLFAFVLLSGSALVLDRPARYTSVFELVPRGMAMKAIAFNTAGMSLTRIAGPAVAGYLIAWFGAPGNFYVQALMYGFSALCVLAITFPPRSAAARKISAWEELLQALKFAATDSTTRSLLLLGVVPFSLMAPIWAAMLPIYAKDIFHAGPEGYGMMLTAGGLGGTLGAWAATYFGKFERQGLVQVGCLFIMCAVLIGLSVAPTIHVAIALLIFMGGAEMALFAMNQTHLQMAAPEAMRGRISSLLQIYPALISLGSIVVGSIAELIGARAGSAVIALTAAALSLAMLGFSPGLRTMRLSNYR